MDEAEGLCVEGEAVDRGGWRAVAAVAGDGVSGLFHVHADLVLASGCEAELYERVFAA